MLWTALTVIENVLVPIQFPHVLSRLKCCSSTKHVRISHVKKFDLNTSKRLYQKSFKHHRSLFRAKNVGRYVSTYAKHFFIIYFINYLLNQPKTQKLNDQFQKPQHYWTILRLMKRLLVQSLPWFSCGCVKTVHQDSKTAFSSLLKTHSLWDNVITCLNTIDTFWLWNYQQLLYAYFL